ncbi:SLC13 family permease [Vibrio sinaloensis]|uniref:SLC13 family permease n=1 Tax=Photobacterium sp. (strain ATCC 43367) TaxID=379097 RepID=UPI00206DA1AB|nr:SLC13 family permease [Vibrio sinaloensis]UPQ89570.1 SLC13 family permease [Vibrio sinaloensis]
MFSSVMNYEQYALGIILLFTISMFLFSPWRHDMVAFAGLVAAVLLGIVAPEQAFLGFGHPAVVTVGCILILSQSLQNSGAVDVLARTVLPQNAGRTLSLLVLMGLGAFLSGFMNNVGAMALLMPIAIQLAQKLEMPPGQILMPLAFGTILGGMTTLIGTPPNLIVAGFRKEAGLGSFGMFDFTPIGVSVALAGILFVAFIGWRLVPSRAKTESDGFDSGAYLTELYVTESSKVVNLSIREIKELIKDMDAQITGIVRNKVRIIAPNPGRRVTFGDILIVEAEADSLNDLLSTLDLELLPHSESSDTSPTSEVEEQEKEPVQDDIGLFELAVMPSSKLCDRRIGDLALQARYGANLLALSREGHKKTHRLRSQSILSGDLLLLQGNQESINAFASDYGCVPLAQRELRLPNKRNAWLSSLIMLASISAAAMGILPATIAFALGVVLSLSLKTIAVRKVYDAVDWSVIVLLAALIPIANAIQSTGMADIIANFLLNSLAQGNAVVTLILILVVTMFLSDLMNNAATAAVMCPIAIGSATALNVSPDSFLMAVAIGASCAFLTPIGHQNNTLILGPSGFKFSDYWKLGLPLELIVIAISVPLLLIIWPL